MLGNKGGVGISLNYYNYSILLINCHLAAGQKHYKQRNKDFCRINTEMKFDSLNLNTTESLSDQYDICIWTGDFNYRVELPLSELYDLLLKNKLEYVLNHDQFYKQIESGSLDIDHFYEARINFFPTYKFIPGTDDYDTESKQPSWTDRILYKTKYEDQLSNIKYNWIKGVKFSDHKPVICEFVFNIKKQNFKPFEELPSSKSKACVIF